MRTRIMYAVRNEIVPDMDSIVTPDYKFARKYARVLVKKFRDNLINFKPYPPKLIAEMKAEKIEKRGPDYFAWWGRKAEVEEVVYKTGKP